MVSRQIEIISRCSEETRNLGKTIGTWIKHPLIIALIGDLGSGKTVFVQGLSKGLEIPAKYYITSPTFTLINEYPGRYLLFHVDLYRLDSIRELEDIGLDELLCKQGVIAIEWADKLADHPLAGHLSISFEIIEDDCRKISLIAYGLNEINLIKALEKQLKSETDK